MSGQATDVSVYKFNHTMFRIKDPKVSIPFYEDVLGMEVGVALSVFDCLSEHVGVVLMPV
jgi:catechol 2,3-dioxygenase-like lactoylglutathione lyase family enzyme